MVEEKERERERELPAQFILAFCKSKQRERTTNDNAKVARLFFCFSSQDGKKENIHPVCRFLVK
jgi:hypothetical protein